MNVDIMNMNMRLTFYVGVRKADTCGDDLDENLASLRKFQLPILDHKWCVGFFYNSSFVGFW